MTNEPPIDLRHTAREGWSELRVEAMRQHLRLGLSCTESGILLGLKRNAVCGKRWRLGLKTSHEITLVNRVRGNLNRTITRKPKKPVNTTPKRSKMNGFRDPITTKRPAVVPAPLPIVAAEPSEFSCTIVSLDMHRCKFPVGDAIGAEQLFCGRHKAESDVYCGNCKRIAYKPSPVNEKEYIRSLRYYFERR